MKKQLTVQDLFKSFTISDYFINKSLIFAQKTLQSDEFRLYKNLFQIINLALPKPDLLVFLYLDIEKLKQNIIKRGRSYEKEIKNSYLEKIQEGYLNYIKQQSEMRILIIDTNNLDFVNCEDDYKSIINEIDKEYDIGIHRISFA